MAKLVALYKTPADRNAFDAYYFDKHVPLAKAIPGLRRYEVSVGPIASAKGDSGYGLVAVLSFDSFESLQQGMGTPEAAATTADLQNFAQAGVELLVFDTKEL
ncbi:EthD family reductase [Paraburkholderia sp. LEh10]|uniref:EthD family reductase n=1 Tax=Paraburkholderia sp. LEh10 TaxID=2821353 RepID=UPI001AEB3B56|nr:EthD family reductase [Paraburkholderia sp. LEh10]MBP0590070.1 EthD family reductase [Paraburkholderia sp. LEh10]